MNKAKRSYLVIVCIMSILGGVHGLQAGTEVASPPAADTSKVIASNAQKMNASASIFDTDQDSINNQSWMLHAQNTEIVQGQPGFHSPYAGQNSIHPNDGVRQTISLDLFTGFHLWPGGEVYFNPEFYQGFGFASTHGFADFSNADAYKVGQSTGDVWIPHGFYRQTFGLGGEQEQLSTGSLQLAEKEDVSRITITAGSFCVTDLFDNNAYANNGRTQFMNWTFVNGAAFDYSSNSLGGTQGLVVELNQKDYAVRVGGFRVDRQQNGNGLDEDILKGWQDIVEYDQKIKLGDHPGVIRVISWLSRVDVGAFGVTLGNPVFGLDPTQDQKYRYEYGFVLNVEQEITDYLGAFGRISYRNGQTPDWDTTDVDQSISGGVQIKGTLWGRPNDVIGHGVFVTGLSDHERAYYVAGGQGVLVGDGALNYQEEYGVEDYYNYAVMDHVTVGLDYQLIADPGYNVDRGPINIFSARLHLEY